MKKITNIATKLRKGFLKLSLGLVLFILLLFLALAGIIQIPSVQKYLLEEITVYASEITEHKITIKGVRIDWFDEVVLEEATLYDKKNGKMIHLNEAVVDYTILSLLRGDIKLDNIILRKGEVNLMRYVDESDINISEFIAVVQELTTPKVKRVGPPVPVILSKFTLDNMLFSYNDYREPEHKESYFDHNHFTMDSIFGSVTDLYAVLDTIQLKTHKLRVNLRESHIEIHELTTDFLLDKHQIECKNLYARISESEIKDYFRFYYNDINDLSDFNEKTTLTINLKESTISMRDIAHFAPSVKHIKDELRLSGNMHGRINRFIVDSLDLAFGKSSDIKGKLRFDGLPNISETFMDLKFKSIKVSPSDVAKYTGKDSEDILYKLGKIKGSGNFIGLVNDFTVNGTFATDIGHVSSDVNLKIDDSDNELPYYRGDLITHDFQLGKILDIDALKKIDIDGVIEGKGFNLEKASFNLKADIKSIDLYDYSIKNITTEAGFSDRFFDGFISIKDSNLILSAEGKIDLKKQHEVFDIIGKIEKAHLEKFHIIDQPTHVSGDFDLDFTGTNIDSILGKAVLTNVNLSSNEKEMHFNKLYLDVHKNETTRFIDFNSEVLNAHIKGDFYTLQLIQDIQAFTSEILLFYDQNKLQIENYYNEKPISFRDSYVSQFSFDFKNINGLLDLFYPGVYISENTFAEGAFNYSEKSELQLKTNPDTIIFKGNEFYKNNIDFAFSKSNNKSDIIASALLSSGIQNYKSSFKTKNFFFDSQWLEDNIFFNTYIEQYDTINKMALKGVIALEEQSKKITFNNSYIDIIDERWILADSSSFNIGKYELAFNNFRLSNKEQEVTASGSFSDNEKDKAIFIVNNFNLHNVNPVIDYKINGILDGKIEVKNIYKNINLDGNISIKNFTVENFEFGDIIGSAGWSEDENRLNVKIDLFKNNDKVINVAGYIKSKNGNKKETIHLIANFNSANLGVISPLLIGVMSDINGTVDGKLKISGSFDDIRLSGDADISDGQFKVDYLGSVYHFDDKIYFTEDQIKFKNLTLSDINGNKGRLNGGIFYDGFKNFLVDIKGDYKNLNVLNTTEKDNSLFYGTANISGTFGLFGPFNDLEIKATAKSEKETKIYIPLTGDSEISQKDFIKFISKTHNDNKKKTDSLNNFRIRMLFNMEITPDAYSEIIFDKRAGDIIRGRGEGNIELHYDSRGDMTMFGSYAFKEGRYNFTMAGIVNKEFIIDKGSRLTWNGSPYDGILDIKAKYSQNVSLSPLFDTTYKNMPDLKRSYPTDVILLVKGNLLTPEITMDIDIKRYPTDPSLSTIVTDFEAKIKTNEQELNRQVFSLIMLRSFTAPNSFSGVSSIGSSTVSELLSGQLSQFLSQVDQNLEINVNLKKMDKDALNTFNLRFSYTMLDGRLRITRDGNFQNVQSTNQANVSNIAGEWTVEYLLSHDGKLRIKLFNRINNNALISSSGNTNTTAGASVMHVQSFNNLRELVGKKSPKRKEEPIIPMDDLPDSEIDNDSKEDDNDGIIIPQTPEEVPEMDHR